MKGLQQKYGQFGPHVIMAHSAEYELARDITNLRSVQPYNANILIDYNGFTRYEHAGYGCISEFEESIRYLLKEMGEAGKLPKEREPSIPLMKYMTHKEPF